jgi:hypothetical protein
LIRVGAYLEIPKAQSLWADYGLILALIAVVVAVFAAFKMRAERLNRGLSLIADEQQSFWHHAKQQDGSIVTQFALQFHATSGRSRNSALIDLMRLLTDVKVPATVTRRAGCQRFVVNAALTD